MKKKGIAVMMILVLLATSGCQLAKSEQEGSRVEQRDQFIGVYITLSPVIVKEEEFKLSDMVEYKEDITLKEDDLGDPKPPEEIPEEQRIYATPKLVTEGGLKTTRFFFEEIEGISFYEAYIYKEGEESYRSLMRDNGISNSDCNMGVSDTKLEGTIFHSGNEDLVFYLNPVYETKDGKIYLAPTGVGYAAGMESSSMNVTQTFERNGEAIENTCSVILNYDILTSGNYYIVKQYDENDTLLSKVKITKQQIPETIKKEKKMSYAMIEQHESESLIHTCVSRTLIREKTFDVHFLDQNGIGQTYEITLN